VNLVTGDIAGSVDFLGGIEEVSPLTCFATCAFPPSLVKFDLERAGIPYKTADGVADFHAAGRHTHITELLRNGHHFPRPESWPGMPKSG
jgi:hypothetical protein